MLKGEDYESPENRRFFPRGRDNSNGILLCRISGNFVGRNGLILITLMTTCLGVLLGCTARNLAREKMKMSPFVLTMCYVAGTLAVIAALFIIFNNQNITGFRNLEIIPYLVGFLYTIPSAAINAVVQIVLCVREKIKLNKEKQNGTL